MPIGTALDLGSTATAAMVKRADAEAWLRARGVAARLLDRDGAVTTVGGWPVGG